MIYRFRGLQDYAYKHAAKKWNSFLFYRQVKRLRFFSLTDQQKRQRSFSREKNSKTDEQFHLLPKICPRRRFSVERLFSALVISLAIFLTSFHSPSVILFLYSPFPFSEKSQRNSRSS